MVSQTRNRPRAPFKSRPHEFPLARRTPVWLCSLTLLLAAVGTGCGESDQEQADRIADEVVKELQGGSDLPLCSEVASGDAQLGPTNECIDDD